MKDLTNGMYQIWANGGADKYTITDETTVVDLRSKDNKKSTIDSVEDLFSTDWNAAWNEFAQVAYVVNGDDEVLYIYVVDGNTWTVHLDVDTINTGRTDGDVFVIKSADTQTVDIYTGSRVVEFTIARADGNLSSDSYTVKLYNHANDSIVKVSGTVSGEAGAKVVTFEWTVTGNATLDVMSVD